MRRVSNRVWLQNTLNRVPNTGDARAEFTFLRVYYFSLEPVWNWSPMSWQIVKTTLKPCGTMHTDAEGFRSQIEFDETKSLADLSDKT